MPNTTQNATNAAPNAAANAAPLAATPAFANEDQFSAAVHRMIHNEFPMLRGCAWHVPNECERVKGESERAHMLRLSKRKAIGVIPGVWDWHIRYGGRYYVIELKIGSNKLSEAQVKWLELVQPDDMEVCYTLEQVRAFIIDVVLK